MAKKKKTGLPKYVVVKNDKWHIRRVVFINGKRKEITRRCKIETEEFAEMLLKKVNHEIDLQLNPSLRSEKTFGEFFEYWFVQKSQKKNAIRTQETYRDTFDNHLSEIKDVLFSFVSPHDIKRITDRLEKKQQFRTAQQVHALARLLYNDARKMNIYNGKNPADQMFPPTYRPPEAEVLTRTQAKRLLKIAKNYKMGIVIDFALETAMRPGEIFGLQWKHIDFKSQKVSVRQQVIYPRGGGYKLTEPKWKQKRNIGISKKLVKKLKKWKEKQSKNYLSFVFPSKNNLPMRPKNFNRRNFKKMAKEAGLSESVSLYALRHTTATLLLQNKMPLKYVSSLLGHSNINITASTYVHYLPEMETEISESLTSMLYD